MTEKKKFDENIIWMIGFVIVPFVLLRPIVGDLLMGNAKSMGSIILSAVGGMIGMGVFQLTATKDRKTKIIAMTAMLAILMALVVIARRKENDDDLVSDNWELQHIGALEFETPNELKRISAPSTGELFATPQLYTFNDGDRIISAYSATLKSDSTSIVDAFTAVMEQSLLSMNIDLNSVEMDDINADENTLSTKFSIPSGDTTLLGFGYLFKHQTMIESLWLFPLRKGFSESYIKKFKEGIVTNPDAYSGLQQFPPSELQSMSLDPNAER